MNGPRAKEAGAHRAGLGRGVRAPVMTRNGRSRKKEDRSWWPLTDGWWLLCFSIGFIGGGCLLWALFLMWLRSGM